MSNPFGRPRTAHLRSECANSHPYTPETTRITKSGRRVCLTCRNESVRRFRARARSERESSTVGKTCRSCGQRQSASAFVRSPDNRDGLSSTCKRCRRAQARDREFGLIPGEYDSLLRRQGDVCAICHQPESLPNRSLCVDHDHNTGTVRGLLCMCCNRLVGQAGDDPERLVAAAAYLQAVRDSEMRLSGVVT